MASLQLDAITMDFTGLRALDEVSLELKQGEILGLIGPNGSGKTTTVNVMTGFLKPTSGRVVVDNKEVTGLATHLIAKEGVRRTFQTIRLFKDLTVFENIEVAGISANLSRSEAQKETSSILERLRLSELAEQAASTLPYGEERRVEIARALIANPKYLLLDEPAAGMNESESDALLTSLPKIIQDYGCGLLIIDHDMRLIMRLCERLHVLNYGRTIAEGSPEDVRTHPEVIKAYLGTEAT